MKRDAAIPLPDHAYIPGETTRHASGAFDVFHDSVLPGSSAKELTETIAWRAGLLFLQKGYFWEAHEVLEPVWMALPDDDPDRQLVQALIQYANAGLKRRMNRPKAAQRLAVLASAHFRAARAGRLWAELLQIWPDVEQALDAIVSANPRPQRNMQ